MREVVIYSSNSCGNCKLVKQYLAEKGVEFKEKNVSEDREARKELIKQGIMGVPALFVEGEVIVGFDKAKLDNLF